MGEKNFDRRFGGPILKDKLFFFLHLERKRYIREGTAKIESSRENPYRASNLNSARPSVVFLKEVRDYLINTYGYNLGAYQGYTIDSFNDKYFLRFDWNISDNHKLNFRYNRVEAKSPSNLSNSFTGSGLT